MVCYLDTSAWIAWKFSQTGQEIFGNISLEKDTVISSPLLIAEYVAFLSKMNLLTKTRFEDEIAFVRWLYPTEPFFEECMRGATNGTALRGADLYHLTCALWFSEGLTKELLFLTCDQNQSQAAKNLGFQISG